VCPYIVLRAKNAIRVYQNSSNKCMYLGPMDVKNLIDMQLYCINTIIDKCVIFYYIMHGYMISFNSFYSFYSFYHISNLLHLKKYNYSSIKYLALKLVF